MMNLKPLQIWLVNFPFSNLNSTKVRPTLIWTQHQKEFIILGIFSKIPVNLWSQSWVIVSDSHPDFNQTGLKKTSLIRTDKIATVNLSVFHRQLGNLPCSLMPSVQEALKQTLNLD